MQPTGMQRRAYELLIGEQLTHAQIAVRLGISRPAATNRIRGYRKRVGIKIEKRPRIVRPMQLSCIENI